MFSRMALMILACSLCGFAGEDEAKKDWTNVIDLSVVWNSGNTKSNLFRVGNAFKWERNKSALAIDFSAARVETYTRTATGTAPYDISHEDSTVSEDRIKLGANYHRSFSEKMHWLLDATWERDKVAGLKRRTTMSAGLGTVWIKSDRRSLTTDYMVTMVEEVNVVEIEGADDSYPAVSIKMNHQEMISATMGYAQKLGLSFNTDESEDFRLDWNHQYRMAINSRLGLKLELDLKYDHQPAFDSLPLYAGNPPVNTGEAVIVELEDLDTVFLVSLSYKF